MKKFLFLLINLLLAIVFVSCNTSGSINTDISTKNKQNSAILDKAGESTTKKIGLVMKTLTNPFFIEMEKGARNAEKEFGINLIVKTGAQETSIDQQIAIVDGFIKDKMDAIVIAPGDSKELIAILKKAHDAGIVIVNIDNRLDADMLKKVGLTDVPFISVDNENAAFLSASKIVNSIKTPTNAIIIEGIRGADNAEMRKKGALRAFAQNPNVKLIASETANWKIDEASTLCEALFEKNPNIRIVFAANDMMGLGVVHYLKSVNNKNVLVSAFDALPEAKTVIKEGWMVSTIDQQPDLQGYTGIKYAVKMLSGEKMPSETMLDVKVIDSSNVQ